MAETLREVILDTETTGLDPAAGHRVVEIGLVEMLNGAVTGAHLQAYFNPERDMPEEARAVHGLGDEFLAAQPLFGERAEEVLAFIGEARLVIHNAQFDMGFMNAELDRLGRPPLANPVVDTITLARRKYPGQRNSLDALCERLGVDNAHRAMHGALLDARLLAEVYIELTGGRQRGLALAGDGDSADGQLSPPGAAIRAPRPHQPSAGELAAHAEFLKKLKDPIWTRAD